MRSVRDADIVVVSIMMNYSGAQQLTPGSPLSARPLPCHEITSVHSRQLHVGAIFFLQSKQETKPLGTVSF